MNTLCHKYLNQNILPFIGREEPIERLQDHFETFIREGESTYMLVSGEVGMGKSRLVREFEKDILQRFPENAIVLHVRYLEGNAAAITPIMHAFSAVVAQHEGLAGLLRRLDLFTGESGSLAATDAPPLQLLLDSFTEIARRFPLLLILEDIHNVEEYPALEQFFLGLSSVPKFVVFSERTPAVVEGRLTETSAQHFVRGLALREEKIAERLAIGAFGAEQIARLLNWLFDLTPSETLIHSITEITKGRPLHLRSMLRQIISSGMLHYEDGSWSENIAAPAVLIPEDEESSDIQASRFQRELERLNPQEQLVITFAAVLGEQFDIRLLRAIVRLRFGESDVLPEAIFTRVIDLLLFKSIIRKATPSVVLKARRAPGAHQPDPGYSAHCYEFAHPAFWETILSLYGAEFKGDHELVLQTVTCAFEQDLPLFSTAVLGVSGSPFIITKTEQAILHATTFLRWASGVADFLWAIEPQQTLRFLVAIRPIRDEITWRFSPELDEAGMAALIDLHSMVVEALMRIGSLIEAERDLEHSAVLEKLIASRQTRFSNDFRALTRGKILALRAILAMSRANLSDFDRWAMLAKEALAAVTDPENVERARLQILLIRSQAEGLLAAGKFREADQLIQEAFTTAELLGASRFDEYCLFHRLAITSKLKQDQNAQAAELTEQLLARAKERHDTLVETTFLYQATVAAFSVGDLNKALQYAEQGITYGRRYGIRFVEMMSYLWRMIVAGVYSDTETATACSQQLDGILQQTPNLLTRISLIEGRATTMNFLGRYQLALEHAEEAIQLAESKDYRSFVAWAHNEKGMALIGLGRYQEAEVVASACLQLAGEQLMAERLARTVLIRACVGLGKLAEALALVEQTRPLFKELNPYYLRFAQAESQLLRAFLVNANEKSEQKRLVDRLAVIGEELITLANSWNAKNLVELLEREYQDVLRGARMKTMETLVSMSAPIQPIADTPRPRIRLFAFGPMSVTDLMQEDGAGQGPELPTSRTRDLRVRQLISLLIVARIEGSPMSKESLADTLWPESDLQSSASALHTLIKRARAFLGDHEAIVLSGGAYALAPIVTIDVEDAFRHHDELKEARRKKVLFAIAYHYEQILALSDRGPLLEGIYGLWLEGTRARFETIKRTASIKLIHMDLDRGLLDRAERTAQRLLSEDEFDEEAMHALLTINARKNQTTKLHQLYDTFVSRFRAEFRSEPSQELKQLFERIKTGHAV